MDKNWNVKNHFVYEGEKLVIDGLENCGELSSVVSIAIAIVVFLVIAGCVSLAGAIVGCCGTCCNKNEVSQVT